MPAVLRTPCYKVTPLLARLNDSDLTEAERVLLSTHLLACPDCRARVQEYRLIDGRIRGMASTTIAPRVRGVILQQLALSGMPHGGHALAQPWRHTWSGLAIVFTLTTFLCAAGVALTFTERAESQFATNVVLGNGAARPMTMTILNAAPTSVILGGADQNTAFRRPVTQVQSTRPAAVGATVRLVNLSAGQIVVSVTGARSDERIVILRDTAIVLPDGKPGVLADLSVGTQVQLQRESTATGGVVAREIVVTR
jgi:anti-sigma factor RsiW